jgi:Tol biopolymer transport system component
VFSSNRSGTFDLWKKSAGELVQLTHGEGADRDPAWSPDGTTIAFVRAQSGHADLWLLDVGTGTATQLTHDGAHDAHPTWLPDGTIVYDSDRSRMRELWAADSSDGIATQLDVGPGNNSHPSASTNWDLAWVSDRTGAPSIWRAFYFVGPPPVTGCRFN